VWVGSDGSQTISRISPTTNRITAGRISTHEFAVDALAASTGGVLLDRSMRRLDPATNQVGPPTLPGSTCGQPQLAGDATGSVWYLNTYASSSSCPFLAQYDSSTGKIVQRWGHVIPANSDASLAVGDGQVWIVVNDGQRLTLYRFDPQTGSARVIRRQRGNTYALAVGDGVAALLTDLSAYGLAPRIALTRISDASLRPLGTTSLPVRDIASLAEGGQRLWAGVTLDRQHRRNVVETFNVQTGRRVGATASLGPNDFNDELTYGLGALWVAANYRVVKITS
jgi:hypothetical protein